MGVLRRAALLVLLLLPVSAGAQALRSVTVGWESGLKPPYLVLDQDQRPAGIAVELVSEIFRRQKIQVNHVVYPWTRCLDGLKQGLIDLVPNSSYQESRAAYAYYTRPLYETHLVLFYRKSQFPQPPAVRTVEDLARYTVMGVKGFNYDRYQNKVAIDDNALDREALIKKLQAHRGDLAAEQKEVLLYMRQQGLVDLTDIGSIPDPAQAVQTFYILVSRLQPRAPEITALIDEGLEQLKKDGTYQKITAHYLGSEP